MVRVLKANLLVMNPYQPTNATPFESALNAKCPRCERAISWGQIATSSFPVFLKCRGCEAKLLGSGFVKLQALAILCVGTGAFAIHFLVGPTIHSEDLMILDLLLGLGFVLFVLAMVPATVRWGRYRLRNEEAAAEK